MVNTHKADCHGECPVYKTAQIIEGKWTTLIIRELLGGKKRYSELQKSVSNISPKLLASRLRLLEQNQLVKRKIYPTMPVTTEYELTALGRKLEKVIVSMSEFGQLL